MYAEPLNEQPIPMTEAEYLAFAEQQEYKHEYSGGYVYAMSGGTVNHAVISANAMVHCGGLLRDKDCTVLSSNVRVHIAYKQAYRYPDVTVFCGEVAYHEGRNDTLTNPILLVEVLSSSTETIDRKDKLAEYTRIDSLQVYMLVSQDAPHIEVYQRHESDKWLYQSASGLDAELVVTVSGAALTLSLAQIYRLVRWEKPDTDDENTNPTDTQAT